MRVKRNKLKVNLRNLVIPFCAVVIASVLLFVYSQRIYESTSAESAQIAHDAIIRALITCYAAEGSFSASIEHLEEYYGIVIDRERYVVSYQVMGSNVMPHVRLVPRE